MLTERKTEHPLEFIIIGGSIAGLATAYALRRAGHAVLVLEKSDGTLKVGSFATLRSHRIQRFCLCL
jgi:salicylate hydroxylase